MKPVSILVGALAAVATAAPTVPTTKEIETRASFDLGLLNNLNRFNNVNLNYLLNINSLNLQLLAQLGNVNNFNVLGFQGLFQSNVFDLNALLQLQQLEMVLQLAQLGLFNGFDLSTLAFNQLNLGLINNIGGFDFNTLIDNSIVPQITSIAQQTGKSSFH